MNSQLTNNLRLTICASFLAMATACGGGGAGDEIEPSIGDTSAIAVAPFIGVWDLPNDWNGIPDDEAYLLIKSPDSEGIAEATIYDLDDTVAGAEQNCFIIDGTGTLSQSLTDELFLDVPAYPTAKVILTPAGQMEISVFSESAGAGASPDRVLIASFLGITENEIELCN